MSVFTWNKIVNNWKPFPVVIVLVISLILRAKYYVVETSNKVLISTHILGGIHVTVSHIIINVNFIRNGEKVNFDLLHCPKM